MTEIDKAFSLWRTTTFGNAPLPNNWKTLYAEHLLNTKSKTQIWKMLCGPATKSCLCKCPCPAGIAWDQLLSKGSGHRNGQCLTISHTKESSAATNLNNEEVCNR